MHLRFNENDEMVEEEEKEEEPVDKKDSCIVLDIDELKKKLKGVEKDQQKSGFNSKVTVNIGLEEYDKGKQTVTEDLFEGKDKTQNAELFIENLQKTKQRARKSEEKLEESPRE